jgi:hypothetical protein
VHNDGYLEDPMGAAGDAIQRGSSVAFIARTAPIAQPRSERRPYAEIAGRQRTERRSGRFSHSSPPTIRMTVSWREPPTLRWRFGRMAIIRWPSSPCSYNCLADGCGGSQVGSHSRWTAVDVCGRWWN